MFLGAQRIIVAAADFLRRVRQLGDRFGDPVQQRRRQQKGNEQRDEQHQQHHADEFQFPPERGAQIGAQIHRADDLVVHQHRLVNV